MLYIHNAVIYTPGLRIKNGALLIEGNRIIELGPAEQATPPAKGQQLDASGLSIVPGFIDLQLNGGFGLDFTAAPDAIWPVAAQLPQYGVTSFLPTIITAPLETIRHAQSTLAQGPPPGWAGAMPLGLHLEGPFLNPQKKGAHSSAYLREPSLAAVEGWSAACGVKLVTLAPELPGALAVAAALVERGVAVSAGHSTATIAQARAGFEAGINYGTHLFNAMPPLHHREPGLAGALLAHPTAKIGLISDGVHVHPDLVKLIWQLAGPERLTLVTDAMAALGMGPGHYQLGDYAVTVDETSARLADGTLAGSILSADVALRNLIAFTGCSLPEALLALTRAPAALLGLSDQKGILAAGGDADLVLLSADLQVVMTIVQGQIVYQKESLPWG